MKIFALPLLNSTRTTQNLVGRTKLELDDATVEAVTSRARDIGEHLGGDVGSVHRIDKLINDSERRLNSLNQLEIEAEHVQRNLTLMQERALELGVDIEGALLSENQTAITQYKTEAEAELGVFWDRLNTSFNGRQPFAGAAIDTPPLGDLASFKSDIETIVSGAASAAAVDTALNTYFNDTLTGAFHTTVYQGSATAGPDREASESRRIGVDAKATDLGVRNILRGLALMTAADQAATPEIADELMQQAATTLNSGGMQVIQKQAELGVVEEDVRRLQTITANEQTSYELLRNEMIGVDQYAAATRMQNLTTQLEATYLSTSRIANLSLVNYL